MLPCRTWSKSLIKRRKKDRLSLVEILSFSACRQSGFAALSSLHFSLSAKLTAAKNERNGFALSRNHPPDRHSRSIQIQSVDHDAPLTPSHRVCRQSPVFFSSLQEILHFSCVRLAKRSVISYNESGMRLCARHFPHICLPCHFCFFETPERTPFPCKICRI